MKIAAACATLIAIGTAVSAQDFDTKAQCLEQLSRAIHNQDVFSYRAESYAEQRNAIPEDAKEPFDALVSAHETAAKAMEESADLLLEICRLYD